MKTSIPSMTPLDAIIPPHLEGYRLDQGLALLFPNYSRAYFQKQIKQGRVHIQSQVVTSSKLKLHAGHSIQINPNPEAIIHAEWKPEPIALDLVYEDEALLVINKPPYLVVHPAPGHLNHTLVNALLHYLPSLAQLPRAGIIHRLDRDTSGLLVVPKTLTAHTALVKQLAARQMKRHYYAIVQGVPLTGGSIHAPIGRHPVLRQKQAVTPLRGKPAITHYRIRERFPHHSLLDVQLETGRTHQIRVHMAHIRYPIVGDPTYGSRHPVFKGKDALSVPLLDTLHTFPRQALHAHTLGLQHPLTQQCCTWEAPLPEDMLLLLNQLRAEHAG
jgi:23S rRNA pseudouridine1911/1915/1917 synthase